MDRVFWWQRSILWGFRSACFPRIGAMLLLGILFASVALAPSEAARKYYPPGFKPSGDDPEESSQPALTPAKNDAPVVIVQPSPSVKQVIIKTVPVMEPAKPRDPLDILIEGHRYYDALRLVDTRLKKSPKDIALLLKRASLLRQNGQYDISIRQYNEILSKNNSRSVRAAAWNGLGWSSYQNAQHHHPANPVEDIKAVLSSTESAFLQSVRLNPQLASSWAGLARVYLLEGKLALADEAVRKAHQSSPGNLMVQLARAELLLAKRKPNEALQLLYGLKTITTDNPDVYLLLAKASMATNKTDDAIINLKQLLDIDANHTDALRLLSHAYELKMKPESAGEALESAIALNPRDVKSVRELIKIYDAKGDFERGTLLLRNLLETAPRETAYIQALLERLIHKERWKVAYEEGAKFMPPLFRDSKLDEESLYPVVSLFSRSAFHKGRLLLDRGALLDEPAVQDAFSFSRRQEQRLLTQLTASVPENGRVSRIVPTRLLQERLNLLYMDPLVKLEPFPPATVFQNADIPLAVQVAFLSGQYNLHSSLLRHFGKILANLSPDEAAGKSDIVARQLYDIGDYRGAMAMAEVGLEQCPHSVSLKALRWEISLTEQEVKEQRTALTLLSKKSSDAYWQKLAAQSLQTGTGDWQTHALLASVLAKRHYPQLAAFHEKMALRFMPPEAEKAGRFFRKRKFS